MKALEITTICTATVEERWVVIVDDETAAEIIAEPYIALDAFADNLEAGRFSNVVHVENTAVRDEENRDVTEVRTL